jgi:hypothetical protein
VVAADAETALNNNVTAVSHDRFIGAFLFFCGKPDPCPEP